MSVQDSESSRFLTTCSLSEEQQAEWLRLSQKVALATPSPAESKKGPPCAEKIATLQLARKEREAWIACLGGSGKEDAKRLLELEKQARKLVNRDEADRWKNGQKPDTNMPDTNRESGRPPDDPENQLKNQQKDVMTRAFWLWQEDRRQATGARNIDSTEWKPKLKDSIP